MKLHHSSGLWGRSPDALTSQERLLLAALECFVERGYHGTSIRQIATRAGVSVPGLYHHFASKVALLEQLIDDTMDDLLTETETALSRAGESPVERVTAVIEAHVRFHCLRAEESFVGNTELRSLSATARRRVVAKRDRQQHVFEMAVLPGVASGVFQLSDTRTAILAIVTMCTGVATWFSREGPLTPEAVVSSYRQLVLGLLGVRAEGNVHHAPGLTA